MRWLSLLTHFALSKNLAIGTSAIRQDRPKVMALASLQRPFQGTTTIANLSFFFNVLVLPFDPLGVLVIGTIAVR